MDKKEEIERLEICIKEEQSERQLLQRSSELLMDCVKTLQKKLDAEVVTRRCYQRESQKENESQMKKIDR